jgi:hypothetical protein
MQLCSSSMKAQAGSGGNSPALNVANTSTNVALGNSTNRTAATVSIARHSHSFCGCSCFKTDTLASSAVLADACVTLIMLPPLLLLLLVLRLKPPADMIPELPSTSGCARSDLPPPGDTNSTVPCAAPLPLELLPLLLLLLSKAGPEPPLLKPSPWADCSPVGSASAPVLLLLLLVVLEGGCVANKDAANTRACSRHPLHSGVSGFRV